MINREQYIKEITWILSCLQTYVININSVFLFDANKIAENFYRDLLNHYGYQLKNLNEIKKNADSIDLVDTENKIAIQVTSRNDSKKINETIEGFYEKEDYYTNYTRLIILLIGESKLKYRTDFTNGDLFSFNKETDIIDIQDLITKFQTLNASQLELIVQFLEDEVERKINRSKASENNVLTIIQMIEYLSDDKNYKEADERNSVDLNQKKERFADHFDYLVHQWTELSSLYSGCLTEAKKIAGNDGVRARKISAYLKKISDIYLTENENNPKIALDKLTNYFVNEIGTSGINYDQTAVEFYLLDELINCNVFPNPTH